MTADANRRRLPRWGWKLYGSASDSLIRRFGHGLLLLLIKPSKVASITALLLSLVSIVSLVGVILTEWDQILALRFFAKSLVLAPVGWAVLYLVRATILGALAAFYDSPSVPAGTSYATVDQLIPHNAKQVALVGQNLTSYLGIGTDPSRDEKYREFRDAIKRLLARESRSAIGRLKHALGFVHPVNPIISDLYLVVMTPHALEAIHPKAAEHLRKVTRAKLVQLAEDLADGDHARVRVVFQPAATLSMIVVDWANDDRARRLAVVMPKVQTTVTLGPDRFCFVAQGAAFEAVVGTDFGQFLAEAYDPTTDRARVASLEDAPSMLDELSGELMGSAGSADDVGQRIRS